MRSPRRAPSESPPASLRPAMLSVAAGLALMVAARALGAVPLLVPGIGFILLGLLAPLWVRVAARGSGLTRTLQTHRVVEDEPLELTLTVRRGRLGLPGGEV